MEAEDPLSELADIHLPDAVSAWPPAPGWWLLSALVLFALLLLGRHHLRRLILRRRLGSALGEIERVHRRWLEESQSQAAFNQAGLDLLYGFNAVLKRVALVHYPDTDVPRLTGRAWLLFLDRTGDTAEFSTGPGQVLGDGTYRPVFDADVEGLRALCRQWIERTYMTPQTRKTGVPGTEEGGKAAGEASA